MTDLTERVARVLCEESGGWLTADEQSAIAAKIIAAMQADAVPVAWMYERNEVVEYHSARSMRGYHEGWAETPLYLSPPVGDRPLASNSVDDSETGNTTDKLRDAVEVWLHHSGYEGNADVEQAVREFAAVIEADRAQCLTALQAQADALAGALKAMHHAVCHGDGFCCGGSSRQRAGLSVGAVGHCGSQRRCRPPRL